MQFSAKCDKCFSSICKFNLCKGISNLRLNGQIGKMSNWNPIYPSYRNRCNIVHINYIVQSFHLLVTITMKICPDFERHFIQREICSILSVQLVMLIDESGDLRRDLPNWLDLAHKNIQSNDAMAYPWQIQKKMWQRWNLRSQLPYGRAFPCPKTSLFQFGCWWNCLNMEQKLYNSYKSGCKNGKLVEPGSKFEGLCRKINQAKY